MKQINTIKQIKKYLLTSLALVITIIGLRAQNCSLYGIDFSGVDVTSDFTDRAHALPDGNLNISATLLNGTQPKGENNGNFRLSYNAIEGGLKYQITFSREVYVIVLDELVSGYGHNTEADRTYFSASNGSWFTNGEGVQNVTVIGSEIDWYGEGSDFRVVSTEKVTSIIVESIDGNPWTTFNISVADCLTNNAGVFKAQTAN
ncbi:MAG: hypothetical protein ACI87N_002786 [Flavobacteriales bacterium]|jgi:hypothetical protein